MNKKFAVIVAGAGGTLMAVQLKERGHSVWLMDRNNDLVEKLKARGTLQATGKTEATAAPDLITSEMGDWLSAVEVVMVCTTTDAHGALATAVAPYLRDGQMVVLNPGQLGGVLEFRSALAAAGCRADIRVGEASDLMYACRTVEPGHTLHTGVKAKVKLAAVPAADAQVIADALAEEFPCFAPVESVLHTGLSGAGGMLHSIPCVMNLNKVELGQPFDYYMEGLTPGVCRIIERADAERVAVSAALGIQVTPLLAHLKNVYGLVPDNLYDAIQSCQPYKGIKSPADTGHRFFQEDTLCDLVPTASLGKMLGIPTPTIDAVILLESAATGKDFWAEGRTVEKLGIAGKSVAEIKALVS